jgi:hypothetical protein
MKMKRNYTIMDSGEVFYDDTRGTDTAPPPPYLGFRARMTWYLLQDVSPEYETTKRNEGKRRAFQGSQKNRKRIYYRFLNSDTTVFIIGIFMLRF